jgi:rhomboid protease GluP
MSLKLGSRMPILTLVLVASNVIVYGYGAFMSGNLLEMDSSFLVIFGQYNLAVMNGWYWQLFTAMFVHVNLIHLAGNMLFLFIFGLRAEELFKTWQYLLICLSSGLAGNLLTLAMGPEVVSAGASGAIFGVFGAVTIYVRRAVGESIIGALIFSFFFLVISLGAGVNVVAHLGGLVVGLIIGYVFAERRKRKAMYQFSYSYTR